MLLIIKTLQCVRNFCKLISKGRKVKGIIIPPKEPRQGVQREWPRMKCGAINIAHPQKEPRQGVQCEWPRMKCGEKSEGRAKLHGLRFFICLG